MSSLTTNRWHLNAAMQTDNVEWHYGTCHGMGTETDKLLTIIALLNDTPGNGDFAKLMDILESRGKPVIIEEIWNRRLYKHLIRKRGYAPTAKYGRKRVIKK